MIYQPTKFCQGNDDCDRWLMYVRTPISKQTTSKDIHFHDLGAEIICRIINFRCSSGSVWPNPQIQVLPYSASAIIASRAQHREIQLLSSNTFNREANAFDSMIWPHPSSISLFWSACTFDIYAETYHGELPLWWYRELIAVYPPLGSWACSTQLRRVWNLTIRETDHLDLDQRCRSGVRKRIPRLINFSIATRAKCRESGSFSRRVFTKDSKTSDMMSLVMWPEEPRN